MNTYLKQFYSVCKLPVFAAVLLTSFVCTPVLAKYTVIDAKGGGVKSGQALAADAQITLKEGERVTVIGADGKTVTLRGPFSGPVAKDGGAATDRKSALSALVAVRDARTSSVGVIRAGSDAAPLPSPWLIDVSFSSNKCLRAGDKPVWFRPEAADSDVLTVSPTDRSWKADYKWQAGQNILQAPEVIKVKDKQTLFAKTSAKEVGLQMVVIPQTLDDPVMIVGWMLEKGCVQQANAYLEELRKAELEPPKTAQ